MESEPTAVVESAEPTVVVEEEEEEVNVANEVNEEEEDADSAATPTMDEPVVNDKENTEGKGRSIHHLVFIHRLMFMNQLVRVLRVILLERVGAKEYICTWYEIGEFTIGRGLVSRYIEGPSTS